jgi:hypothetical protein
MSVIGTVTGQQHIHTMHFRSTANALTLAASEAEFQGSLIDTWSGGPKAAYRALFGGADSPVQLYQVRKVCGSTPLPAGVDEAEPGGTQAGTGIAGEFNGDKAAPWLASVTTIRTGYAGRRYRGRWFFGGLYEPMLNVSDVSTDRQNRMTSYCTAMLAAFHATAPDTLQAVQFSFSRVQAAEVGVNCQNAGGDVISFQPRAALATMRSRKVGSGI